MNTIVTQSPCCGETTNPQFQKLNAYLDTLAIDQKDPRRKDKLIMTLHYAQSLFGYLPEIIQIYIAQRFGISHADVSGVISFYNFFTVTPKGKIQVNVCMGTACYVNGADKVLREFERVLGIQTGEVTSDQKFSIESLRCVGACGLAPVVTINGKVFGKVKPEQVPDIIEKFLIEETKIEAEVINA